MAKPDQHPDVDPAARAGGTPCSPLTASPAPAHLSAPADA